MLTKLKDRTLWYDGTNQVHPDSVPEMLMFGCLIEDIVVTECNEEIKKYNQLADDALADNKTENRPFNFEWNLPRRTANINLNAYVLKALSFKNLDESKRGLYLERATAELKEIERRGLDMLFKTLIYVISELHDKKKVWGVGRGSSCASLVLFLIGLHKVDPIKYNIPMTEFFHD